MTPKSSLSKGASQALILTCLKKYGPFTTNQLCVRLGQFSRQQITQDCLSLFRQSQITREELDRYGRGCVEYRWTHYDDSARRADDRPAETAPGVTHDDRQWMSYWHPANRESRRQRRAGAAS